jgi:Sec-independent protein translocase protein TatA
MFGLGVWEIIAIVLVAIVFIRPDDLPAFIRNMGKLYGRLTKMYAEITSAARTMEADITTPLTAAGLEQRQGLKVPESGDSSEGDGSKAPKAGKIGRASDNSGTGNQLE